MKTITLFVFSFLVQHCYAQTTAQKAEVMKPVNTLFDGMKKGDSSMVHSAFTKKVTMATVFKDKAGMPTITYESSLDGFLKSVGTPHADAYNEAIWSEKISIDGDFAQVWVDYAFYLGKKFNHCGVDAFHLMREKDGNWKIFHLADTRRKDGCEIPKRISDQFK